MSDMDTNSDEVAALRDTFARDCPSERQEHCDIAPSECGCWRKAREIVRRS